MFPLIVFPQWELFQTTETNFITQINVVDDNNIWVADQIGYYFSKTTDGGLNWSEYGFELTGNPPDYFVLSSNIAWFASFNSDSYYTGVFKSNDGGETWVKQETANYSEPESWPMYIHFWDDNTGIVLGDPVSSTNRFEIYTTSNGGETWTRVPEENIPVSNNDYYYPEKVCVLGNTIWVSTYKGNVFKSSDNGISWSVFDAYDNTIGDLTYRSAAIAFKNQNEGLLIDYYSLEPFLTKVYKTTDGGENWSEVNYTGEIPGAGVLVYDPIGASYFSVESELASNSPNNFGLYYSTDNGETWQKNIFFDGIQLTSLKSLNGTLYIGKYGGEIYKSQNPLKLSLVKKQEIEIFPNPAKDFIYFNSDNLNIEKIKIFDISGKIVVEKTLKSYDNIIKIDQLKNGFYFIYAYSTGEKYISKFIKN